MDELIHGLARNNISKINELDMAPDGRIRLALENRVMAVEGATKVCFAKASPFTRRLFKRLTGLCRSRVQCSRQHDEAVALLDGDDLLLVQSDHAFVQLPRYAHSQSLRLTRDA